MVHRDYECITDRSRLREVKCFSKMMLNVSLSVPTSEAHRDHLSRFCRSKHLSVPLLHCCSLKPNILTFSLVAPFRPESSAPTPTSAQATEPAMAGGQLWNGRVRTEMRVAG